MNEIVKCLENFFVSGKDRVPLSCETFVFRLLRLDSLILQQNTVSLRQFFHQRSLLVRCLQQTVLVRSEFLELRLEQLLLMIRYGLFV